MVIPAKLNKNGGTVPVLIPAKLLKIMVNVIEVNTGCIEYQSGPKTVCLYMVTTSLFTKRNSKSLYCQTSLRLSVKNLFLGVISNNQGEVLFLKSFIFLRCLCTIMNHVNRHSLSIYNNGIMKQI